MVKLEKVVQSHDPEKKLDAVFTTDSGRTKTVPFGQAGARDYTRPPHDKVRRERYITRHAPREDWTDPTKSGTLSRYILWGSSISLLKNIEEYHRKFKI